MDASDVTKGQYTLAEDIFLFGQNRAYKGDKVDGDTFATCLKLAVWLDEKHVQPAVFRALDVYKDDHWIQSGDGWNAS